MQNTASFETIRPLSILSHETVSLCGLPIFSGSRTESHRLLTHLIKRKSGPAALVFTPNLEMLASAKHNLRVRSVLGSADLLLPDGIGVLALSGFRIKERLPGIEAGEFLLSKAADSGLPVAFVGGKPGIAARAACQLRKRFPRLPVVLTHHGYIKANSDEERALTEQLRAASPAVLIVGMGFPRQEEYLLRVKNTLSSLRLGIGLGGALDVFAGSVRRAPVFLQKCGLEWLFRVLNDPKRIPRLLKSLSAFV